LCFRFGIVDYSGQLLVESQAAIRKSEQALRRGLLEGLSQLVSDFIAASQNYILGFLHKKSAKNVKIISPHSNSTV
jgi:hypothetical protein